MKLHSSITINGKVHAKGRDVPWYLIYPFFMVHMLMFGGSGFFLAYGAEKEAVFLLYAHGGIAISIYIAFYLSIFGRDAVKWMLINALLGLLGIYSQVSWVLAIFDKRIEDYPYYVHVIPFLYFVLYTFLLRQAVLDFTNSRENPVKRKRVEHGYVAVSFAIYTAVWLLWL
jgi:hypothetical protein